MISRENFQIHCDNLTVFSHRAEMTATQRKLTLKLAIEELLSDSKSPAELFDLFSQSIEAPRAEDKAIFCKHLLSSTQKAEAHFRGFFADGERAQAGAHGRVALVNNPYNDEAFSRFSRAIVNPKKAYFPSFIEMCESVIDGKCEFCVLPMENTRNGRLFGFYDMIDRYELKICAVTELDAEEAVGRTRYGLIGKSRPDRIPKNSLWNFEFSVVAESERFPTDILQIAPIFEATALKIDSIPLRYDEDSQRIYFSFRLPESFVPAFDLYLSKEHSRYTTIGYYPLIF